MKNLLILFFSLSISLAWSQSIIFDEYIEIEDYEPEQFIMPPSPLTTQILFVGGHDIVQCTPTYGNPAGRAIAKEWHDFIGFTPDDNGESLGWISVNHEQIYEDDRIGDGGGMTVFRVKKDGADNLVVVEQTLSDGRNGEFFNVDFVNTVGETGMNCAGISAPNGRIWSAEEWYRTSTNSIYSANMRTADRDDSWNPHSPAPTSAGYGVRDTSRFTIDAPEFPLVDGMEIDKYQNFNYMVEIDPKEAKAIRKQYNWGRASWEGGAITKDGKYAYLGIDASPAPWVRAIAQTPWNFTDVTIQVYKQNNPVSERWITVPATRENMLGNLLTFAWEVGASMFMRNEWVAIDQTTGMVYWTETGRDGSNGAGSRFATVHAEYSTALPAQHHESLAQMQFGVAATDAAYQDYYGRVMHYNPISEEVGVTIAGGPFLEDSPDVANYPGKHLSNPDGLNMLEIDGEQFLMIQEDLNGTSNGRTPEGISNKLCELYLLAVKNKNATIDDLIRVTAIPAGAEITGAIQIDENTILVNSQHPNANNPFPFNHSLTMAIHGWNQVLSSTFDVPELSEGEFKIYPNPTTRIVHLSQITDCAIYSELGKRVGVYRSTNELDVSRFAAGMYYIKTADQQVSKLVIKK